MKQNSQLSLPIHIKEYFPRYYHNKADSGSCNNKTKQTLLFLTNISKQEKVERLKIFASERRKKKGKQKKNWENCKGTWNYKVAFCIGDRLNVNSEQNMLKLNANYVVNKKFVKIYLQKWNNFHSGNIFSKTSTKLFFFCRVATWKIYRLLIQSGSELWL